MSGKLSRRGGAVDPFIVMDVMAAAAEKEAAGESVIHLEVGQPSTPAPKGGAGRRPRRARYRPHRLCRGTRHAGAARAHRAPLPRSLRCRDLARSRDRHDRFVGRLSAGVSRELRCRRSGGAGRARLSRLPQHPGGAQPRGGRPADLGGRPLPADGRGLEEGGPPRRPDRRQPVQSDGHHGGACRDEGAGRLVHAQTACG